MQTHNIRPLQEETLKIFKVFNGLCEKHNLRYYAAYGTALGAVRHKGFIPWDDDFDVVMPRADYNRFVKIAQIELPQKYKLSRGGIGANAPIYFTKILNLEEGLTKKISNLTNLIIEDPPFIDVFVLESIPDNILQLKKWFQRRRIWRLCQLWRYPKSSYCTSQKGIRLFFARLIGCFLNNRYRVTKSNEDMMYVLDEQMLSVPQSETVIEPCFFRMKESRLLSRSFFEPARIVPFEDTYIKVPANVELILSRYYGNYLELPPEKDRIPPHVLRHNYEGHV